MHHVLGGWLLAVGVAGCDSADSCPEGSVYSPHFGQCVGVEEGDEPVDTAVTVDTGATATGETGSGS